MIDRYTKVLLTVIAANLTLIVGWGAAKVLVPENVPIETVSIAGATTPLKVEVTGTATPLNVEVVGGHLDVGSIKFDW